MSSRKIVFSNFYGNGYGDNPKYIAEELIRQNHDCELVWLLRHDVLTRNNLPSEIRAVGVNSLRAIYELATARVWVDNVLKPKYVKKRKGQFYIQTAHGGPSLKRLEEAAYVEECQVEAKKIDLFLSNSSWYTSLVRNGLQYYGDVLECGVPRNDILFQTITRIRKEVLSSFNIAPGRRVALYAPTWRAGHTLDVYTLDIDSCLKALSERFSGSWTLLLRLHPNIHGTSLGRLSGNDVMNATEYEDVQELLCAADALITDYSSIMFDFAITNRPVFLYTPDVNDYARERGFYFDLEDLPFAHARDNLELSRQIREFDLEQYVGRIKGFFEKIDTYDHGDASKTVVGIISSLQFHRRPSKGSLSQNSACVGIHPKRQIRGE